MSKHCYPEYFTMVSGSEHQGDWTTLPEGAVFLRKVGPLGAGAYRRSNAELGVSATYTMFAAVEPAPDRTVIWREYGGHHTALGKGPW